MNPGNPVVRLVLVRDQVNGGLQIRKWENLDDLCPGVHELYWGPVELGGISEQVKEGAGFWSPCSGCYETEDGQPVARYAYSAVMQSPLGAGCRECGGLGAVWDNIDYDELAHIEGLDESVNDEGAEHAEGLSCECCAASVSFQAEMRNALVLGRAVFEGNQEQLDAVEYMAALIEALAVSRGSACND
jgi:hypothetical protein